MNRTRNWFPVGPNRVVGLDRELARYALLIEQAPGAGEKYLLTTKRRWLLALRESLLSSGNK